jgi:hypothetical protein
VLAQPLLHRLATTPCGLTELRAEAEIELLFFDERISGGLFLFHELFGGHVIRAQVDRRQQTDGHYQCDCKNARAHEIPRDQTSSAAPLLLYLNIGSKRKVHPSGLRLTPAMRRAQFWLIGDCSSDSLN